MMKARFEAVLFDLDGTLLDTAPDFATATNILLRQKKLPQIKINPSVKNIFDFKYEDFSLEGYDPYPLIKAPVAV